MFRVGTTVAARVWSKYVELFWRFADGSFQPPALRVWLAAPIFGRVPVSASARAQCL
jgi:hypothetical protein